ncbi:DUF1206 domain-containing protein [Nocardioides sp. YIM 152315]|uniref:DUF1206 domain-containing protein n=1 Tax=Nocardioides sp. YIM 152315 TaxID=3031760 RepID=UPI0023DCC085|nr:DUF1206 domain-containing protein [Nocardioides sp. YIM 152315]MDF1605614.1 DUF1206 domain-containing protein [Nocardioides sp. YIM 152315]
MPTPRSTARSSRRSPISPDSGWIEHVARVGLVAYAVVYLLIAWLAIQLALGDSEGKPSSSGAFRELAQQPFGDVLIWVVAVGLFLLAAWQLLEAAVGHRDEEGATRAGKRVASVGKALVYVAIGASGVKVAVGSGSSGQGEETWTARLMSAPAGQVLVGLVALGIIGFGLVEIYRAWTDKLAEKLDAEGRSGRSGTAYLAFGKIGYTARGVAFAIVGGLVGYAAVTHDASKSGGLDQALMEVLQQPFGPALLCAIGIGLACFGVFTLAQARHLSGD